MARCRYRCKASELIDPITRDSDLVPGDAFRKIGTSSKLDRWLVSVSGRAQALHQQDFKGIVQ